FVVRRPERLEDIRRTRHESSLFLIDVAHPELTAAGFDIGDVTAIRRDRHLRIDIADASAPQSLRRECELDGWLPRRLWIFHEFSVCQPRQKRDANRGSNHYRTADRACVPGSSSFCRSFMTVFQREGHITDVAQTLSGIFFETAPQQQTNGR